MFLSFQLPVSFCAEAMPFSTYSETSSYSPPFIFISTMFVAHICYRPLAEKLKSKTYRYFKQAKGDRGPNGFPDETFNKRATYLEVVPL